MTKQEMINHLKANYKTWGEVYEAFKRWKAINNWFVAYDGDSIYEMYLNNVDPSGDESGEVITDNDFK